MRALRGFFLLLLLLMGAALTNAQNAVPLLDPITDGASQSRVPLTSPQMLRARYVAFNPQALNSAANVGAQLQLNLFDDAVFTAITTRVEARLNGASGYVWYGEIPDMMGSGGVMVVGDDSVSASFFTPQGHFTIEREESGFYRVTQLAPFENPTESDAIVPPAPPASVGPEPLPAAPRATGGYVDVMVLVTPAARDALGGMATVTQRAESMVAIANLARMNSGITMQMRLVHVAAIPFTEGATMNADLDYITFSHSQAHSLRDQYGADIVSLITKDKQQSYCGLGWLLMSTDNLSWRQQYGYNVVSMSAGGWGYDCTQDATFAHESGHNMGGSHDHANTNFGALTPYSYGYQDPKGKFATVMAYSSGGSCTGGNCARILMFSTPKVKYLGRPIGKADWADMARLLNMTSPFVANFRTSTVDSPALPAFDLVAPSDMTELASKNTAFTWNAVAGASNYQLIVNTASKKFSYRAYIDAEDCTSTCTFDTSTVTNWNPPAIEDMTWRVKAFNSVYQNSVLSTQTWTLKTRYLPKPVLLNTPDTNAIITAPQVTFTWPDDARVEKFRFVLYAPDSTIAYNSGWLLADDTLCPSGMCALTLNLTALSKAVKEGAVYKWRVDTSSSSVPVVTFSWRRPFNVDVLPASVEALTPADQEIVPTRRPVFTWTRAANVTQYRFVYKNSAKQLMTGWLNADAICDASVCTLDLNTQTFGLPLKVGEWFVQGRIPKIAGAARSASRKINVVLP